MVYTCSTPWVYGLNMNQFIITLNNTLIPIENLMFSASVLYAMTNTSLQDLKMTKKSHILENTAGNNLILTPSHPIVVLDINNYRASNSVEEKGSY